MWQNPMSTPNQPYPITDGWVVRVSHFKHSNSDYIMPAIVQSVLVRAMVCIKEIICLG